MATETPEAITSDIVYSLGAAAQRWMDLLTRCHLSAERESAYLDLLGDRLARLEVAG